uniref:Uncharacterized protein n=1 Tax=Fagus sylvatica TaxID=28930 RepID=A0A2N9EZ02_FAGSY
MFNRKEKEELRSSSAERRWVTGSPDRGASRLARGGGSRDLQIGDGAISRFRERDRLEVGHGLRGAVGHGLRSSARRRCDLQGARERPARGSRLREAVGHGCDLQIGDGEIFRSGARARARSARGGGFCARRGRLGVAGGGWGWLEEQKKRAEREESERA